MKIIHVLAGLKRESGGPSYTVPRLCESLIKSDCRVDLLSVASDFDVSSACSIRLSHDWARIPFLSAMAFSNSMKECLDSRIPTTDIIHNHGLWRMPNVYSGRLAKRSSIPLVVSPRGMLSSTALKFSSFRKRAFWHLLQRSAFESAALWHATCDVEAEEIRSFGITAPIAVIPNGIDIASASAEHLDFAPRRTLLALSRLHPKKGFPLLIEAWSRIAAYRPEWDLLIVGPDEDGHRAELQAIINSKGGCRVYINGPMYGRDKDELFKRADLFVLTTYNENFGVAVAEALASGLPAVVTKGAPWRGLHKEGCGWWVDHSVEALSEHLKLATSLPASTRKSMGCLGRSWMERDFGWQSVSQSMIAVYTWLKYGGVAPSCVYKLK